MLEQGIIDDIGVNFLFKRGTGLKEGLIDIDRAYSIIQKIDNTLKESQLNPSTKENAEICEEKLRFDLNNFCFDKDNIEEKSENSQSQKSFLTSSSVPKKADFSIKEDKWMKIIMFLRANPNLLLKIVPTTMAVDEQGVEMLHFKDKNLNKDINFVNKSIRIKSATRK